MTLNDLITEDDGFTAKDIELVFNRIDEFDTVGFGIDVIDWEVIGKGGDKEVGILFDIKGERYGYYSQGQSEIDMEKLDKSYQELSDWGDDWVDPPKVLQPY